MDPSHGAGMQYQRAVTPTIDKGQDGAASVASQAMKGKPHYQLSQLSNNAKTQIGQRPSSLGMAMAAQTLSNSNNSVGSKVGSSASSVVNVTMGNINFGDPLVIKSTNQVPTKGGGHSNSQASTLMKLQQHNIPQRTAAVNSLSPMLSARALESDSFSQSASVSRYDLISLSDDIPSDGIIFSRIRNNPDSLVVFRTPEERIRNPERLNLDRRQLDICPILEQEHRLRLLNYQNNHIKVIQNLENLQNLIFLDMYNNKVTTLDGPLSTIRGLRVLMAGKNKISMISNLTNLRKLDVLDLHSNDIKVTEGLDGLNDLRVLNLAGNKISVVQNLASLQALTELNLRRNVIERVYDLDKIPSLQRVFLSHNQIRTMVDIACIFEIKMLVELSLDGNPVSDLNPIEFRTRLIAGIKVLRHLDLKRVSDEERAAADEACTGVDVLSPIIPIVLPEVPSGADTAVTDFLNGLNGDVSSNGDQQVIKGLGTAIDTVPSFVGNANSGLAALARSGSISFSAQSFFDLEIISPNEKALTIVGDSWEWISNRRMFGNVTEMSLYHVRKELISNRVIPHIANLPALRCLRLVNNGIECIQELEVMRELFVPTMTELLIKDNPVCFSKSILKSYVLATFPCLRIFNGTLISDSEKSSASAMILPLLRIHGLMKKEIHGITPKRQQPLTFRGTSAYHSPDDLHFFEQFNEIRSMSLHQRRLAVGFAKAFEDTARQTIQDGHI